MYIPEFAKQLKLGGDIFLQKSFNAAESNSKNTEHLAGIWAAKEAVIKAMGKRPNKLTDILIVAKNERPVARVGDHELEISISHHGDYAVAVAKKEDQ